VKLRAFHGADGDCLLLTSGDEEHALLVDGGRSGPFTKNASQVLAAMREVGRQLDLVCVSHIDDDHISGILTLVEDELAWRVFEFQSEFHPEEAEEPDHARPPEIAAVWHNALFELVGEEMELRVAEGLSTHASLLLGSSETGMHELAESLDNLATGEAASLELSRRLSAEQLGIPVNPEAGGGLLLRGGAGELVELGEVELRVLGPSEDDVERLRGSFQKWLDNNAARLARIRAELVADEDDLSAAIAANPMLAASLGQGVESVTPPNLASIMLYATEGDESVLLTGDGVSSEILEGLDHHGLLADDGTCHVTVLKVQHHGALANVTDEFVRRVTADHYLFCGNGRHENPEIEVIEAFARARLEGFDGGAPFGPDAPFKFWFTSSPESDLTTAQKEHMERVDEVVEQLAAGSGGRLTAEFLETGSFEVLS
jgi:Metallo-beta-lactamase superfamily